MTRVCRLVAPDMDLFRVLELRHGCRYVFGYVYEHGAGPARTRNIKGLFYDPWQIPHVFDKVVMLGAGAGYADDIGLLKGVVADKHSAYLPGENDQRHGVHVSAGNAGHRVRRTGTGRNQGYTHSSRGAGIAIRCMDGTLLVPHEDLAYVCSVECIGNVKDGSTRIAENRINAFHLERFNKYLCSVFPHTPLSFTLAAPLFSAFP